VAKANIKMVLVGIISLLMIIPAMVCIDRLGTAQIQPDQPVTRTENDAYETSWIVIYDNNLEADNIQIQMWSAQVPNLAAVQAVDENAISIESTTPETGDKAVYPVSPWIVDLLAIIVPLSLVAGAIVAFSQIVSQVRIYGFGGLRRLGQGGAIKIGELIGAMIGVLFAVVLLVKITPIIYEYATDMTGVMGFGILVSLIPVLLLIGVVWKVAQEFL